MNSNLTHRLRAERIVIFPLSLFFRLLQSKLSSVISIIFRNRNLLIQKCRHYENMTTESFTLKSLYRYEKIGILKSETLKTGEIINIYYIDIGIPERYVAQRRVDRITLPFVIYKFTDVYLLRNMIVPNSKILFVGF